MFGLGNSGADLLVRSLSPPLHLYNNQALFLEYAELALSQSAQGSPDLLP